MRKFLVEMELPEFFIERDQSGIYVYMDENKPWICKPGNRSRLAVGKISQTINGIELAEVSIKTISRQQTAMFCGPDIDAQILSWYNSIVQSEIDNGIIPFEALAKIVMPKPENKEVESLIMDRMLLLEITKDASFMVEAGPNIYTYKTPFGQHYWVNRQTNNVEFGPLESHYCESVGTVGKDGTFDNIAHRHHAKCLIACFDLNKNND